MNLRTDTELLTAAITQSPVDVYAGGLREFTGIIARFTPISICVKDPENSGESTYFWRGNCVVKITVE